MHFNYVHCNGKGSMRPLYKPRHYHEDDDFVSVEHIETNHQMRCNNGLNSFTDNIIYSNFYYAMHKADRHMASMRVFSTIMLNAWRKRRNEVKFLYDEIRDIKQMCVKYKMQLHAYKTLYAIERLRNERLNGQLMRTLEDFNSEKKLYDDLASNLLYVQNAKTALETALQKKQNEYNELSKMFDDMKIDLLYTVVQNSNSQCNLYMEQQRTQQLKDQRDELIHKICELREKHERFSDDLHVQEDDLNNLKKRFKDTQAEIKRFQRNHEVILKNQFIRKEEYQIEIANLKQEFYELQCSNDKYIEALKTYANMFLSYQRVIFRLIQCCLYYLLPTTPTPRPCSLNVGSLLQKILSFVRR